MSPSPSYPNYPDHDNLRHNAIVSTATASPSPGAFQGGIIDEEVGHFMEARVAKKDHYEKKNGKYDFDDDNTNEDDSYNERYFNDNDAGDRDHKNTKKKTNNEDSSSSLTFFSLFRNEGAWFMYTMVVMIVLFIALIGYGLGSGLFIPDSRSASAADDTFHINNNTGGANSSSLSSPVSYTLACQDYKYQIMTLLGLPNVMERTSPQAQAIEWLAFEDEPLFVVEDSATTTTTTATTTNKTAVTDSSSSSSSSSSNNNNGYDDDYYEPYVGRLEQRYSLVVWYFDQGGPKLWTTLNREPSSGWINFGSGVHECQWKGIDCDYDNVVIIGDNDNNDDNGIVVGLRLSPALGIVLTGTSLSTELGLLTSLRRLDVSDQRLQGTIPDEWSKMIELESLILSKNQLQTTIPEWIGNEWTKLEILALDGNLCYGDIPSSLSTLTGLRHIDVQQNQQLSGRFDETLMMSSSLMSSASASATETIEYIDISYTNLTGSLPNSTNILPNLRFFRAWNTRGLEGSIPSEISSWSNLEVFSIDDGPNLLGTLPTQLGLLTNLKTLEIQRSFNVFGTLPTELGLLTNLEVLNFGASNHNGTLPIEYSQLTKLEKMDFMTNQALTGTLPIEYSSLVNLKYFDLRATGLEGEVSPEICAIDFELFKADCGSANDKSSGKMICACCTWCYAIAF